MWHVGRSASTIGWCVGHDSGFASRKPKSVRAMPHFAIVRLAVSPLLRFGRVQGPPYHAFSFGKLPYDSLSRIYAVKVTVMHNGNGCIVVRRNFICESSGQLGCCDLGHEQRFLLDVRHARARLSRTVRVPCTKPLKEKMDHKTCLLAVTKTYIHTNYGGEARRWQ